LSIKNKHFLIIAIAALGLLIISISIASMLKHTRELYEAKVHLSHMQNSLLTLRKHEKDFLARNDLKYLKAFTAEMDVLKQNSEEFTRHLNKEGINTDDVSKLSNILDDYQVHFNKLAESTKITGLDHNSGLRGSLREAVHQAEEQLKPYAELTLDMLMLRRHEKDFLARKDNKYINKFDQTFSKFESTLSLLDLDPGVNLETAFTKPKASSPT
jgi:methyl-accepting chemotaxis protein